MPYLHFWHPYFVIAPYMLLFLGVYKFIVSIYGFIVADRKNRPLLVVFSLLLVAGFIGQLASIFIFWQLRTEIQLGSIENSQIMEQLIRYGSDPKVTEYWDEMQQKLSCCGGLSWDEGYDDYRSTPIGINNSVPDSCCIHGKTSGCASDAFLWSTQQLLRTIHVQGCVELLQKWLNLDVQPMIGVYTTTGAAIALVEIIAVVLSSAYVAQITRRKHREEIMWYTVNGRNREFEEYDSLQRTQNDVTLTSCNDTEV